MPHRLKKYLIITVVVLAVLVLAAVVLLMIPEAKTAEKKEEINLFNIDTEKVTRFVINFEDGSRLELLKDGGTWRFAGSNSAADFNRAHLTATYLSYMFADHLVEKDTASLSKYGLANPRSTAEFYTSDGMQHRIEFGSETADKKSIFMRIDGQRTIYTLDSVSYSIVMGDARTMVNTALPDIDRKNIIKIELRNREGTEITLSHDEDGWHIISPYKFPASPYALAQYMGNMPEITLGGFASESIATEHGFTENPPYVRFTDANGKSICITLGGDAGEDYRYCTVEGIDGVYKIYISQVILTEMPAKVFVDPTVWHVTTNNTKSLKIAYKNDIFEIISADDKWMLNKTIASNEVMNYILSMLSQMKFAEIAEDNRGEQCGEIIWTNDSGSVKSYTLYDYKKSFLAVDEGADACRTVNKQVFEDFIKLLNDSLGKN